MNFLFLLLIIILICFLPLHFLSVNHNKLTTIFGDKKGLILGKILGMLSGWGYFICLLAFWIVPQPRFFIILNQDYHFILPKINIPINIINMIIAIPEILLSIYFGILGVKEISLEVSETHKTKKIIKTGIYSRVRHPQYLAAILAHIGFSILFASFFSFLTIPLIILYNYLISWKEEKELIKEFEDEYKKYKQKVPMFIPKFK